MVLVRGRLLFHRYNRQKANAKGQQKSPLVQGKSHLDGPEKIYTATYHFVSLPRRHPEQLLAALFKLKAVNLACTPLSVL